VVAPRAERVDKRQAFGQNPLALSAKQTSESPSSCELEELPVARVKRTNKAKGFSGERDDFGPRGEGKQIFQVRAFGDSYVCASVFFQSSKSARKKVCLQFESCSL